MKNNPKSISMPLHHLPFFLFMSKLAALSPTLMKLFLKGVGGKVDGLIVHVSVAGKRKGI